MQFLNFLLEKHCTQFCVLFKSPVFITNTINCFFPLGFAALQLFGALMPRFLGQKRRRIDNDEDMSDPDDTLTMTLNSVTAQELFSRHVDLAPFLLKKLEAKIEKPLGLWSSP